MIISSLDLKREIYVDYSKKLCEYLLELEKQKILISPVCRKIISTWPYKARRVEKEKKSIICIDLNDLKTNKGFLFDENLMINDNLKILDSLLNSQLSTCDLLTILQFNLNSIETIKNNYFKFPIFYESTLIFLTRKNVFNSKILDVTLDENQFSNFIFPTTFVLQE